MTIDLFYCCSCVLTAKRVGSPHTNDYSQWSEQELKQYLLKSRGKKHQ
jgi:hypothetical protein